MKHWLFLLFLPLCAVLFSFDVPVPEKPIAIVMHGGAGGLQKGQMSPEGIKAYEDKMNEAMDSAYNILKRGGSSMDAVEKAINIMENSGMFDAGKGAYYNAEGHVEADASIMDGSDLKAGSVACTNIKNPITAARAVMEHSPHVMLVGLGADKFAKTMGLDTGDNYFYNESRYKAWKLWRAKQDSIIRSGHGSIPDTKKHYGTVGVVALDKKGNIAAGTSTGGAEYKRPGRIGDSPIIGAGTYADNRTCGVSCTGVGEYFIRLGVARDVSAMMEYKGYDVKQAASKAIEKVGKLNGGLGGIIVMDAKGNIAMDFNTSAMHRAYIDKNGKREVLLFKD